jgi:hypothetical protein
MCSANAADTDQYYAAPGTLAYLMCSFIIGRRACHLLSFPLSLSHSLRSLHQFFSRIAQPPACRATRHRATSGRAHARHARACCAAACARDAARPTGADGRRPPPSILRVPKHRARRRRSGVPPLAARAARARGRAHGGRVQRFDAHRLRRAGTSRGCLPTSAGADARSTGGADAADHRGSLRGIDAVVSAGTPVCSVHGQLLSEKVQETDETPIFEDHPYRMARVHSTFWED